MPLAGTFPCNKYEKEKQNQVNAKTPSVSLSEVQVEVYDTLVSLVYLTLCSISLSFAMTPDQVYVSVCTVQAR